MPTLFVELPALISSVNRIFCDEKEALAVAFLFPELANGPLLGRIRGVGIVRTLEFDGEQTRMGFSNSRLSLRWSSISLIAGRECRHREIRWDSIQKYKAWRRLGNWYPPLVSGSVSSAPSRFMR